MATTPTRSSSASTDLASPAEADVDAAKAPAATAGPALSSTEKIVELADHLSACADQLHERVMQEIRSYGGRPVPEHVQDKARALFEDEVLLRQRANGLHVDAATLIVKGLGKQQAQLVKLTADAAEKIRKIGAIGEAAGLVGGLLALAGAAATGQPALILAAVDKIDKHGKALNALKPKPPAKAS
ncbi:hypothetical protein [Massilia sp. LC238]|uniref:hypothetical protein n=1 Tax=Massilia sp. LC238 TaxID=1502852 RepID=UPI0004E42179|nr:hypothetical protein [Massilia sp. LC238]KFC62585.1 hypothetical protein FG94_04628 [Massilia sp. LC238]